ncbi:uncharacterized protein LAESUDRAFT_646934 [Laetiporus sulphureus 93-53]|uniref:Apoptogenic protein 1, mitochondrial n=1 Tax=Laetiporus sulphureus 93-53 TaxID=1314785 RepID=A0A165FW67_9APHY|nr:uncharacterized protein LAESUDRAFT_646934 [Laetiporus sulphureus 93-53]KZT09490.1 hypothetical protein LAESUDRAFT_646934 [Laetiporus sulphureus 93-53]
MLVRIRALCPRCRGFHASARRTHLVGAPHPVSNLRPIIYNDTAPMRSTAATHPYSLTEFEGDTQEYQWKIQRQQLDAYNHAFWADSNSRFQAAKAAVLESLPESCTAEDREFVLSEFYRRWVVQEMPRQKEYDAEWRKQNWKSISLGARLAFDKFAARISHPFSSSKIKNE